MTAWHGVTLDDRSADMMDEVERLCGGIIIDPTQGSYSGGVSASAGTHDGGGAIDIAAENLPQSHRDKIVYEMRRVGWAAWHRTPDQSDWPHHIHGIAVQPGGKGDRGCLSSGAHEQVHDYYAGRNGLASNAPDDGPRDFVGATWETYRGSSDERTDWLLEEVIAMASSTVVFFVYRDTWYEADLLAGTYRAFASHSTLEDRRHILGKAGVPWINWEDGAPVSNPDAFGKAI